MVRRSGDSLARLLGGESVAGLTDGQLLDRFATHRRGAPAEAAFEALVRRHGPMVARVCRQNLRDENDVEDAFQATFLVLVRRADSLGERDLLGPWLYGVAHRVARKARAVASKRRGREGEPAGVDPPARLDSSAAVGLELAPVLHEEVNRLPAKYREPVVLCHLQGLTHAEAARELAWPVGTVSVRLVRARQILADRLTRRGVTASVAALTTALAAETSVSGAVAVGLVPAPWIHAAVAATSGLSLTTATAGPVSAGALTLARRTSMTMLLSAWKWLVIPPTVALATAASAGLLGPKGQGDDSQTATAPSTAVVPAPSPTRPSDDPFAPPKVQFYGDLTKKAGDDGPAYEADDIFIQGTVADLATMVEHLKKSDPTANYRLRVFGGKLRFGQEVVDRGGHLRKDGSQPVPSRRTAEPELTVNLTGPTAVVPGQHIEYVLTVTNPGPALTKPIMITAALPHEGGKLARGPLPARAAFDTRDRKLIWKVDRLNQGQAAKYKFIYETNTPGQYRCVAEVVAEPFRAIDELVTAVGEPAQPEPSMTEDAPEPTLDGPQVVAVPPVRAMGGDHYELGPLPADYFNLPAAPSGQPGSPRPVQVGQKVRVEVLEALPGRPITGERVVRQDGTISLGFYGDLLVVGLNRDQIKVKVVEKLRHYLTDDVLGLFKHNGTTNPPQVSAVPPLETNRVYVDDQLEPTGVTVGPKPSPGEANRPASGPARVQVGQTLVVDVLEALPGRPITGERVVRPDGTISLGFYGDLAVAGLTRPQIKVRAIEHLRGFLTDEVLGLRVVDATTNQIRAVAPAQSDRVFVEDLVAYDPATTTPPAADGKIQVGQLLAIEALQALPGRPITGQRIVHPDGMINLGFYGEVPVVGLTRAEAKTKVVNHLRAWLSDEALGLVHINAQGAKEPVAPADSANLFVDDVVPRPESKRADTSAKLQEQVADLTSKLDAALAAINELRQEKVNIKSDPNQASEQPVKTNVPSGTKPLSTAPNGEDQALYTPNLPPGVPLDLPMPGQHPNEVVVASLIEPTPINADAELDRVLTNWDKQSTNTKSLTVRFERVDKSTAWGDQTTQGSLVLKSPGLACMQFQRAITNIYGRPVRKPDASGSMVLEVEPRPYQRWVANDKELLQYESDWKAIYVYPIRTKSEKSPRRFTGDMMFCRLPFLFDLNVATIRQQYKLEWLKREDQHDLIQLTPQDRATKREFNQASLWLDQVTAVPSKLLLVHDGKNKQEFHFTQVNRNPSINEDTFRSVIDLPGWKTNSMNGLQWFVDL